MRLVPITAILLTAGWLPGHAGAQGQTIEVASSARNVRYPTMLDMTFPEFEAAAKKTDIVLFPIGAIEEHSSHLPLGTDAMKRPPRYSTFSIICVPPASTRSSVRP